MLSHVYIYVGKSGKIRIVPKACNPLSPVYAFRDEKKSDIYFFLSETLVSNRCNINAQSIPRIIPLWTMRNVKIL